MKLYQALTQISIDGQPFVGNPDRQLATILTHPLHNSVQTLTSYIASVLQPGSRHDQNNLNYVSDPIYVAENYDFVMFRENNIHLTFEAKMQTARSLVADLNRHVSINVIVASATVQLLFVD